MYFYDAPPLVMTSDSAEEQSKVAKHARGARLVLRIAADETGARCRRGKTSPARSLARRCACCSARWRLGWTSWGWRTTWEAATAPWARTSPN
jgi:hypothetical protein